uniref:modifier of mdg4-like isoform X12 n=1 Tax=Anopheles coluzzii TaxID=1518534 RepID=UPI0020FF82FF|nr:modifier of mdg4-like isoform X12 [Anopheles coluzzii]
MADDEQFSLCWNNFNSNLSAGFHESLQRGDLVDVTLAAEGHLVKAHRLILSVCSPYFRKMFTQVPVNQHAFIFLKDVSHSALQDLIQFMYCGEVNVKQDALPAFISTAEALQIKGLTETGDSAPTHQSPAKEEPAAAAAVPVTTATISTATIPASPASQRAKVQRNRIQSYKLESEESGDDKVVHIQATTSHHVSAQSNLSSQKRTMPQRGLQSHASKRTKMSISASSDGLDTSDSTPAQVQTVQTVQIVKQIPAQVIEPEYIELPIESINPKAEPDYTDETAEIETVDAETEQEQKLSEHDQGDADDDGNYVEDDTYGDMAMGKYEESYLTEGEEGAKPGVSGFVDSYTSDGGNATEISTQAMGESYSLYPESSAGAGGEGEEQGQELEMIGGQFHAGSMFSFGVSQRGAKKLIYDRWLPCGHFRYYETRAPDAAVPWASLRARETEGRHFELEVLDAFQVSLQGACRLAQAQWTGNDAPYARGAHARGFPGECGKNEILK